MGWRWYLWCRQGFEDDWERGGRDTKCDQLMAVDLVYPPGTLRSFA
jgi:hypothetical protein